MCAVMAGTVYCSRNTSPMDARSRGPVDVTGDTVLVHIQRDAVHIMNIQAPAHDLVLNIPIDIWPIDLDWCCQVATTEDLQQEVDYFGDPSRIRREAMYAFNAREGRVSSDLHVNVAEEAGGQQQEAHGGYSHRIASSTDSALVQFDRETEQAHKSQAYGKFSETVYMDCLPESIDPAKRWSAVVDRKRLRLDLERIAGPLAQVFIRKDTRKVARWGDSFKETSKSLFGSKAD
ncbi:hypothetical protein BC629DRAFT_1442856 [Irpex lacteus]|nr:hypothetical protein BC629DRAFT_1442856 [Irpex lacteus]